MEWNIASVLHCVSLRYRHPARSRLSNAQVARGAILQVLDQVGRGVDIHNGRVSMYVQRLASPRRYRYLEYPHFVVFE